MNEFLVKHKGIIMRFIAIMIVASCLVSGCSWINDKLGIPHENIVEEMIEQQIQNQIGISIDLTPETPE